MSVTATFVLCPWSPMVFGGRQPFCSYVVGNRSYPQCDWPMRWSQQWILTSIQEWGHYMRCQCTNCLLMLFWWCLLVCDNVLWCICNNKLLNDTTALSNCFFTVVYKKSPLFVLTEYHMWDKRCNVSCSNMILCWSILIENGDCFVSSCQITINTLCIELDQFACQVLLAHSTE